MWGKNTDASDARTLPGNQEKSGLIHIGMGCGDSGRCGMSQRG